ncbi:MAG TPA: CPBP family intramembrane glutamic endopeptidase [Woeseiaceae bacterium]|nr:CPBP family intramembrane glutamic endopeptidase [Woeseiaceae bacterium]
MRRTAASDLRLALAYAVTVLGASWAFQFFIIANGGVDRFGPVWLVVLMCIPGVAGVVLRLVTRSGFDDAGLGPGLRRYYAHAVAIPALVAALLAAASVALDIRRLAPASAAELVGMAPVLLLVLGLGLIGACGEELGWRGFLLPKLMDRVKRPYALTGVVWAAWHLPLIAVGGFYDTEHPVRMVLVYAAGILAMNAVLCELRMRSGSVWVAALAHAAHNFLLQFVVPAMVLRSGGTRSRFWDEAAGDTGVIVAVLYACTYLVLRRARAPTGTRRSNGRRR